MCGITGYWTRRGDPGAWLRDLAGSVDALRQRGPDDHGVWVRPGGRVALGQTRLAILDLTSAGHQPMRSPDGSLAMAYNGEVYNFAAVRSELEGLGHRFRSTGDSEVILAAFQEWGVKCVDKFLGMFAIAIWNEHERRLFLIRDRLGVKPLYYAWNGNSLWFGSELKALRAFDAWQPEIDRDALGEYLQFGYVSAPRSIYKNVRKLVPGHWLELGEVGEPVEHLYWSPLPVPEPFTESDAELERHLEFLLIDSFRYRTVADVPVGVFLSGGVDSSSVAALLQKYGGGNVHTFTIGFDDPRYNEAEHARRVAHHLGTRHTERVVTGADMRDVLTHWPEIFDEPFGDSSGVPTYLVSKMARESVKVALSADGGDELFGGYHHYRFVPERARGLEKLPRFARAALGGALRALGPDALRRAGQALPHAARRNVVERLDKLRVLWPDVDRRVVYDLAMSSFTPWEAEALLGLPLQPRTPIRTNAKTYPELLAHDDLRHFMVDDILVKVDRTTMAAGLEGREPFLDHRLVEFALRLPPHLRQGELGPKHLLRKILFKHVPREIIERPKQGFAIPLAQWMRAELKPLVDEYLSPARIREAGLFDPAMVETLLRNFREGGALNDRLDTQRVWYLLSFELWRSRWMARTSDRDAEGTPYARAVCH